MIEKRIVAISGGASGIGRATAERLIGDGYRVAILDLADDRCRSVSAELGENAFGVACDVTDPQSIRRAADDVEKGFGQVFGLVCCAGVAQRPGSSLQLELDDLDRVLKIHVRGALLCCREFAGRMVAHGIAGAIVNIASVVAHSPGPTFAYAPAKAAVLNMTKALAVEWARKGVRINSVSPGWTDTPFLTQRATQDQPRNLSQLKDAMLLGRLLEAREIADVCAFLLSDRASGMIGSDILVDGGFVAAQGYAPYSEGNSNE